MNTSITSPTSPRRTAAATDAFEGQKAAIALPAGTPQPADYEQLGKLKEFLMDTRSALLALTQPNTPEEPAPCDDDPSAGSPAAASASSSRFGNDLVANINALLIQCMQISSELQKSNRQNDRIQAMSAYKQKLTAANDARDAAEKTFAGAMSQAWLSLAGGLMNFGGGVQAGKAAGVQASDTRQRTIMDMWSAGGTMLQSIGNMASAGANREAADSKKAQDQAEALAGLVQSFGGNSNEMANALASTISQMLSELSQLVQARTQANQGIARQI